MRIAKMNIHEIREKLGGYHFVEFYTKEKNGKKYFWQYPLETLCPGVDYNIYRFPFVNDIIKNDGVKNFGFTYDHVFNVVLIKEGDK